MSIPAEVREDIAAVRAFLDEIEEVWPVAAELQWERSPVGRSARVERSQPRGSGIADPTADTVADERRLALRAEVKRTERFLTFAALCVRKLHGEDVPPIYVRRPATEPS